MNDEHMEDLIKQLSEAIRGTKGSESALTIKWAAVIGVFISVCAFLAIGWNSNSNRITKLEAQYTYTVESVSVLRESQKRVEDNLSTLLAEVRVHMKTEKR